MVLAAAVLLWLLVVPALAAAVPDSVTDALPPETASRLEGLDECADHNAWTEGLSRLWEEARQYLGAALREKASGAALLLGGSVDYEFRTTVCAPLHTPEAMVEIGQWLQGAKRYFLQPFVDPGALLGSGVTSLSHEAIPALRCSVLPYIPSTQIRGE